MALSTLRSLITGEPMAARQYEYLSRVVRAVGDTYTVNSGTGLPGYRVHTYRVIAAGPVRPQGQTVLVEEVRRLVYGKDVLRRAK